MIKSKGPEDHWGGNKPENRTAVENARKRVQRVHVFLFFLGIFRMGVTVWLKVTHYRVKPLKSTSCNLEVVFIASKG